MSFYNESPSAWNEFDYGDACYEEVVAYREQREEVRTVLDGRLHFPFVIASTLVVTVLVSSISAGFTGSIMHIGRVQGGRTSAVRAQYGPDLLDLAKNLIKAQTFLNLSQKEIAQLTGLSIGTISRLSTGISEAVHSETEERIHRVIRFAEYLQAIFGNRKIFVSGILRTPSRAFNEKSPLEYALESPEKFAYVAGAFKRMYG